eukprot:10778914-Heterocapsa_arctica.AAC.1
MSLCKYFHYRPGAQHGNDDLDIVEDYINRAVERLCEVAPVRPQVVAVPNAVAPNAVAARAAVD